MKHFFLIPAVVLALWFQGCELYQKYHAVTTYQTTPETADQILIRSEQLTKQALYTFDTYLFVERNNEPLLKGIDPSFHLIAEKVRAHGKEWIVAARNATKTFKANRTATNAANMQTAYLSLKGLYDEVTAAQAKASKLSNQTP